MSDVCDTNQAMAALTYLRSSFGSYAIPEVEERSLLRTFRKFTASEVHEAIEHLKGRGRRPSPDDIEAAVLAARRGAKRTGGPYLAETPVEDLTPADQVPALIAQLKDPESPLRLGIAP